MHNQEARASCLRRMPIIRRPTHGASLGELLEQLRKGDYAPLFEDKNTMLFGKLVKNFSPKTSNKITFSLSLLESESHYTAIVTHFFRLLKFFRNWNFKGKVLCEKLKFLFFIFAYVWLLFIDFLNFILVWCYNVTWHIFYSMWTLSYGTTFEGVMVKSLKWTIFVYPAV